MLCECLEYYVAATDGRARLSAVSALRCFPDGPGSGFVKGSLRTNHGGAAVVGDGQNESGGRMTGVKHGVRFVVLWEARHDNGWSTVIAKHTDGSFVASTVHAGEHCVHYVGQNVAHAHAAVLAAMRWKTGHRVCSSACTDWEIREHGVLSLDSKATGSEDESG
jgi:hypothetical protein